VGEAATAKVFQPLETFFPFTGKRPKNFSIHWKIRAVFSSHWKKVFQSLEKPGRGGGGRLRMTKRGG
jgi:hypothetical protein